MSPRGLAPWTLAPAPAGASLLANAPQVRWTAGPSLTPHPHPNPPPRAGEGDLIVTLPRKRG